MNKNQTLESFGKDFIKETRDKTLEKLIDISKGKYNTVEAIYLRRLMSKNSETDIYKIVTILLDNYIQKILFFYETSDDWAIVEKEKIEEIDIESLAEMSDGLSGELFTEDGWIAKYSKFEQIDDWLE